MVLIRQLVFVALLLCSSHQCPVRGSVSSHLTDIFELSELYSHSVLRAFSPSKFHVRVYIDVLSWTDT